MNNPELKKLIERHESTLKHLIQIADIPAPRIKEALEYVLFPGGKRLRPLLVYLSGQLVNASDNTLDIIAAAVELVHCYSLVHDDLPAMDNDDYRRGKPSCHRAFDEATAILVGDGIQALAVDILLSYLPSLLPAETILRIVKSLVHASGPSGMVSGQSLDLTTLSTRDITEHQLRQVHELKTGKLITASIHMAFLAGKHNTEAFTALDAFSKHLGLVFQMQDDYLDQYSLDDTMGKKRASDIANHKHTFAAIYSQKDLLIQLNAHYAYAKKALAYFGGQAINLIDLTTQLQRRHTALIG